MRRVARLLEQGENPARILVVTFTRTAAADLKRQLEEVGARGADLVIASTLHRLCFHILLKQHVLQATQRVPRTLFDFETGYLLADLGAQFGGKRERERRLNAYEAAWARLQHDEVGFVVSDVDREFGESLERWLRFHGAMLVGELVPITLRFFRETPETPEKFAFDHVLVDEYQDLNRADQTIIEMLASEAALTVVGDDNQSIYGFRYAHPEGILEFPGQHIGAVSRTLTECRRCPMKVVELANVLIDPTGIRSQRNLRPYPGSAAGEVHLIHWQNPEAEIVGIRKTIAHLLRSGAASSAGEIMVLVPRKPIGSGLRAELLANFIQAETVYAEDAVKSDEARARIAILTLLVDPDDRPALRYWLGSRSSSGLAAGYARLRAECERTGVSPARLLADMVEGRLRLPRTAELVERFRELRREIARFQALEGQAFIDAWLPHRVDELKSMRELLLPLIDVSKPRAEMLQDIRVLLTQPEVPSHAEYVRIMTLHKAKGLAAHTVIIAGLVDGLMPTVPREASPEELERAIAEQRRLLYVGVTRARTRLILSFWTRATQEEAFRMGATNSRWAGRGTMAVRPSRFLRQMGSPPIQAIAGPAFLRALGVID